MDNCWWVGVTDENLTKSTFIENYETKRPILRQGLVNQLNGFFGMILLVKDSSNILLLPEFAICVPSIIGIPFEDLFDEETFIKNMSEENINVIKKPLNNVNIYSWQDGWEKLAKYNKDKVENRLKIDELNFEKKFYRSLVPNINSRWYKKFIKNMKLLGNKLNYGAIHPRIEKDYKDYCRNRRHIPKSPSLEQTLININKNDSINSKLPVFISVGADIDENDNKIIKNKIMKNGSPIITLDTRQSSHHCPIFTTQTTTYLEDSLISLWICRYSKWFVGVPNSSFTRLIVKYKTFDNINTKWYGNFDSLDVMNGMNSTREGTNNGFW
jgi:hypothetical protein